MPALSPAQLEILQLMTLPMSESDLAELRTLLIEFLAKKVVAEADKSFDEKGYTLADIQAWKQEHMRVKPSASSD